MRKRISDLAELTPSSSILGTYFLAVESPATTFKVTIANLIAKVISSIDRNPVIQSTTATISPAITCDVVEVNSASATNVTLPSSLTNKYGFIVVKNLGTGTITILGGSGTTMESSYTIATQRASLSFYLSGTVWRAM